MYTGPMIDTDVHHSWRTEADIWPYLPPSWRAFATGELGGTISIIPPYRFSYRPAHGGMRPETLPPGGGRPGSDYTLLRDQLLNRFTIERAVLTHDSGRNNGLTNPYYAQAVVCAINDWTIDRWLGTGDERVYATLVVPGQFPEEAAAEIRRVGSHPHIVGALIGWNSLSKPLGHPLYHPIYEAAADMDLPVVLHTAAGEHAWGPAQFTAAGLPGSYFEMDNLFTLPALHHLSSFMVHGVFDKYPTLKLMCMECGLSWLPWLLWNLEDHYRVLRHESVWLKQRPTDYLHRHVRFSTQPLEESPRREQLIEVLETVGGVEELICYSSDYPHWDADSPRYVAARLPQSWHRKVFYENALRLFRWPSATQPLAAGVQAASMGGTAK